jgi:hypothetical protein
MLLLWTKHDSLEFDSAGVTRLRDAGNIYKKFLVTRTSRSSSSRKSCANRFGAGARLPSGKLTDEMCVAGTLRLPR